MNLLTKMIRPSLLVMALTITPMTQMWAEDDNRVVVAGAGPSTHVAGLFVEQLAKQPASGKVNFIVPKESVKHSGGLTSAQNNLFGRTGRPLNDEEKGQGFSEIVIAHLSIAFVVGTKVGVKQVTSEQLCSLFTGKATNWKEVGGADHDVTVFSREPTEAILLTLKKELPCLNEIVTTKYIYKKDNHLMAALAQSGLGDYAVGFGSKENFVPESVLTVNGFASGVNVGLVYHKSKEENPVVKEAKALAASPEWAAVLKQNQIESPK